jgi:Fe-S-cluster containining protein
MAKLTRTKRAKKAQRSCACYKCKGACRSKPGWYLPGEAERTAKLLGISLQELFDKYLCVDWYEWFNDWGDSHDTFLLAPATTKTDPGGISHYWNTGICIFLKNWHCTIHGAHPHECRKYSHVSRRRDNHRRHKAVAVAWDKPEHQEQIKALLGGAKEIWEVREEQYDAATKKELAELEKELEDERENKAKENKVVVA